MTKIKYHSSTPTLPSIPEYGIPPEYEQQTAYRSKLAVLENHFKRPRKTCPRPLSEKKISPMNPRLLFSLFISLLFLIIAAPYIGWFAFIPLGLTVSAIAIRKFRLKTHEANSRNMISSNACNSGRNISHLNS